MELKYDGSKNKQQDWSNEDLLGGWGYILKRQDDPVR